MKTKPLNILLVCKSLPWRFKGGIQTHTWELSRSLQQMGHHVSILTGGAFRQEEKHIEKQGIEIIEVPYFPGRYIKPISLLAEELSFNLAVRTWVRSHHEDFHIIHAQGRSGYLLHTLRAVKSKLVTTVHGLINQESKRASVLNLNVRLHSVISQIWEKKTMRSAEACVAVSNDLGSTIQENYNISPITIPNGVNFIKDEPLQLGRKPARFLFIGRLHQVKGILPLVDRMSEAPDYISLDIIGSGPLQKPLEAMIRKKGLENKVRLLGEHSAEAIQRTLPYYTALVLPSFYETQGIVLLEANAQAIPVIASDIPAIRETVEHKENGLLCDPNHPETFIDAMVTLAADPSSTQLMGIRGRKRVMARYSWQTIAEETVNIYQKIAS